jgi:hypothetical protein
MGIVEWIVFGLGAWLLLGLVVGSFVGKILYEYGGKMADETSRAAREVQNGAWVRIARNSTLKSGASRLLKVGFASILP